MRRKIFIIVISLIIIVFTISQLIKDIEKPDSYTNTEETPIIDWEDRGEIKSKDSTNDSRLKWLQDRANEFEDTPLNKTDKLEYKELLRRTKNYGLVLTTLEKFETHKTGELRVWIGNENLKNKDNDLNDNEIQDKKTIPSNVGEYAKIKPIAPAFNILPEEKKCIKIHPSGSEVRFILTPKKPGKYRVSADVELFSNKDCSNVGVPITSRTLEVSVIVNNKFQLKRKFVELGNIFWDKFKVFWGGFVTLIFAILIFIFRKFLKKKIGFEDNT